MAGNLSDLLDRIIRIATGALLVALVVVMIAQVFFRYVLNSSLTWSEEVAVYLMIWVVFLGAAILLRRWEHVQIPTVVEKAPMKARIAFILFTRIASAIFICILIWYGTEAFLGRHHATSFTTGISTRWIKLSIPVGSVFMLIYCLIVLFEDIGALRRGQTDHFATVKPPHPDQAEG